MNIRYLLEENLIRLTMENNRVTLQNFHLLPVKLVQQAGEIWLETVEEKLLIEELEGYIIKI